MSALDTSGWATRVELRVRGRLSRVVSAVRSASRPASAWETLAARDLIPLDWTTGTHARAFAPASMCGRCDRGLTRERHRWGRRSAPLTRCPECLDHYDDCAARTVPPSLDDVIGFALDPSGVATAEALGLEVAARLAEDRPCAQRVLWRFRGTRASNQLVEGRQYDPRLRAFDEMSARAWDIEEALTEGPRDDDDADDDEYDEPYRPRFNATVWSSHGVPPCADRHVGVAAIWRAAQRMVLDPFAAPSKAADVAGDPVEALLARHEKWAHEHVGDTLRRGGPDRDRLAALTRWPNPYEPAVAIWALGYGIEAVTDHTVVLIAPTYES